MKNKEQDYLSLQFSGDGVEWMDYFTGYSQSRANLRNLKRKLSLSTGFKWRIVRRRDCVIH